MPDHSNLTSGCSAVRWLSGIFTVLLAGVLLSACTVAPEPISDRDHEKRAAELLERVTADQEPVTGPIDLYEAMARAIKYNLDYRVELMTRALRVRDLDVSRYDMLPRIVGTLDYTGRDNDAGGLSQSLLTGETSLEPSTSSERDVLASDLTMSWDVLDFGLSYVRARQAGDEVMIAEEGKRKVVQRIIEDVRAAFWRAASAERLLGKTRALARETEQALARARQQQESGLTTPMSALSYERELLSIRRDLQSVSRELIVAKKQLAALMNVPPSTDYDIELPSRNLSWESLVIPYEQMLQLAVRNRPELHEVAYQMRSNEREDTAAILRALPNLRLYTGANWSSDDFLYNSDWVSWGAQASWNLLNVFRVGAERDRVAAQGDLLDARALALTMAVATQVSVSRARYELRQRELDTAARYFKVQFKIGQQIDAGHRAGNISDQTRIREQMNTVLAEVRLDVALADLQSAYANVYAATGVDPVDTSMSSEDSVSELAGKLRRLWAERGDALARALVGLEAQ